MKKLGLATALLLAMTGAQAYQFEVQGQSEYLDVKDNDNNDFTGSVVGTYYFKNVDASKGPLAEAAFLNQAANVSAAYNYAPLSSKTDKVELNTYGIRGEYYTPTKIPVYVSGSYSHTDEDYRDKVAGTSEKGHGDRYAAEVGVVATPGFLMVLGYTNTADQIALDPNLIINHGFLKSLGTAVAVGDQQDAMTARMKYVGPITGTKAAIGFEALLVSGQDNAYQLKSDVFFTPTFSVGASYAGTDGEAAYNTWGVNAEKFITPSIAVGANYVQAKAKGTNRPDMQSIGVNAKYRF